MYIQQRTKYTRLLKNTFNFNRSKQEKVFLSDLKATNILSHDLVISSLGPFRVSHYIFVTFIVIEEDIKLCKN